MNCYQPDEPRLALALAAMIMSALTIGLLVVLPSKMEPDSQAFAMIATANANPCANTMHSPVHRSVCFAPRFVSGRAEMQRAGLKASKHTCSSRAASLWSPRYGFKIESVAWRGRYLTKGIATAMS